MSRKPKASRTKRLHLISLRREAEKTGRAWLDYAAEINPDIITADGFESCVLGVAQRFGMDLVVAYDYDKCVALLMSRDGVSREEAIEYMEFNVTGAWVGKGTPVFISTVPPP